MRLVLFVYCILCIGFVFANENSILGNYNWSRLNISRVNQYRDIENEVCRSVLAVDANASLYTDQEAREESDDMWLNIFDKMNHQETQQLVDLANNMTDVFKNGMNSSVFQSSDRNLTEEQNFIIVMTEVYARENRERGLNVNCEISKSVSMQNMEKVASVYAGKQSALHRRLKAQFGLSHTVQGLGAFLKVAGFIQFASKMMKRAINIASRERAVVDGLLPVFMLNVVDSPIFMGTAKHFSKITGGTVGLVGHITLIYGVLKFVQVIGGFDAIKKLLVLASEVPVVVMIGELFKKSFLYIRIIHPVATWVHTAYNATVEHFKNMKPTENVRATRTKASFLDSEGVDPVLLRKELLSDLAPDVKKSMTDEQLEKLFNARKAEFRDRINGKVKHTKESNLALHKLRASHQKAKLARVNAEKNSLQVNATRFNTSMNTTMAAFNGTNVSANSTTLWNANATQVNSTILWNANATQVNSTMNSIHKTQIDWQDSSATIAAAEKKKNALLDKLKYKGSLQKSINAMKATDLKQRETQNSPPKRKRKEFDDDITEELDIASDSSAVVIEGFFEK